MDSPDIQLTIPHLLARTRILESELAETRHTLNIAYLASISKNVPTWLLDIPLRDAVCCASEALELGVFVPEVRARLEQRIAEIRKCLGEDHGN